MATRIRLPEGDGYARPWDSRSACAASDCEAGLGTFFTAKHLGLCD